MDLKQVKGGYQTLHEVKLNRLIRLLDITPRNEMKVDNKLYMELNIIS